MKKIILGSIIACFALLLTGCGKETKDNLGDKSTTDEKVLVCNQKVETVDVELDMHFKDKGISKMDMKYTMDLSMYNDDQINAIKAQEFCTIVKSAMTGFENAFGNCKQNVENKEIVITADLDVNKITGLDIKADGTMEAVKKGIEATGYTCVVK